MMGKNRGCCRGSENRPPGRCGWGCFSHRLALIIWERIIGGLCLGVVWKMWGALKAGWPSVESKISEEFVVKKAGGYVDADNVQSPFPIRAIRVIRDGMKSFSNRRWANRKDLFNVPRGARECLQRARAAEGPNGSTITMS